MIFDLRFKLLNLLSRTHGDFLLIAKKATESVAFIKCVTLTL
jgi:hypothetical protein